MNQVDRAIILAAGLGIRMDDKIPKALLDVGGTTVLANCLSALHTQGVRKVTVVIGYRADDIIAAVEADQEAIDVEFVHNRRFEQTSTGISLWHARDYLNENCLLIEGDVYFEPECLARILHGNLDDSVWATVPTSPENREGILIRSGPDGTVAEAGASSTTGDLASGFSHKCAGIQRLNRDHAAALAQKLNHMIRDGEDVYADIILARTLDQYPMKLCSLEGLAWAEIDTLEDLRRARKLAASPPARTDQ